MKEPHRINTTNYLFTIYKVPTLNKTYHAQKINRITGSHCHGHFHDTVS